MRVLHYIRDFTVAGSDAVLAVKAMLASTSKVVENHLLTATPLAADYVEMLREQYGIEVHVVPRPVHRNPFSYLTIGGKVKHVLKQVQPDLVHVHGSWDYLASVVERKARKRHLVTIVSPHGGLSPASLNTAFWKSKLPRILLYQMWMVRNSTSVIAMGNAESDDIKNLRLKKRVEVMPQVQKDNPVQEPLADALMAAYRKALDSSYLNYLTKEERQLVRDMVRAAVTKDEPDLQVTVPHGVSFRRMYLYAYDEDAMPLFVEGAQKQQVQIPPVFKEDAVPRYVNKKAKKRGALKDVETQLKKSRIPAEYVNENIAVILLGKASKIGRKRLTLRQWTEIYDLFRNIDFDEEIVARELKRQRLKNFTKKIQKTLGKYYKLPAGFDIF